ncbi:MAG: SAM-dependent chlorinase/fluorinase [Chitinophagales bacterium]|nr:SAM-dependent chlorinase/fluorinase [Chitinophagales bacterium]
MPIVSLITDFGYRDFYVGVLKGHLLKAAPMAQLVDICHQVEPFNISEAAFVLRNAYEAFPENTLHIICVNQLEGSAQKQVAVRHNEHFFIGPDNGLFSMAFDQEPELVYELELYKQTNTDFTSLNQLIAQSAGHLLAGKELQQLGRPVFQVRQLANLAPVVQNNVLKGSVIYIDAFQNAVLNIHRDFFEQQRAGRNYAIFFKRSERITEISRYYYEAPEGEKLCIFNTNGYLEIAINKGKAAGLLGLHIGDTVQIEFV